MDKFQIGLFLLPEIVKFLGAKKLKILQLISQIIILVNILLQSVYVSFSALCFGYMLFVSWLNARKRIPSSQR